MQTTVQKWGNSLALRIPKAFAKEMQIFQNSIIELSFEDGNLVISPIKTPEFTLDDLLAGVTEENIHTEVDFGLPVGRELL